jgi:hypothetical protein
MHATLVGEPCNTMIQEGFFQRAEKESMLIGECGGVLAICVFTLDNFEH